MSAVVGMAVVPCVVYAGDDDGPVSGATPEGVEAVVLLVLATSCGGAGGDGVARGAACSKSGAAVAAGACNVVSAFSLSAACR